jgi:hypothetical protein
MHEVNVYDMNNNDVLVPVNDVLKGSWSKGLVVRYNRQRMIVNADICKNRYFAFVIEKNEKDPIGHYERHSTTNNYYIDTPIFNGGDYQIGIADFRLENSLLKVFCNYKTKSGNKLWEGGYLISKEFAQKYSTMKQGKLNLYIIPLEDLRECQSSIKLALSKKPSITHLPFTWNPVQDV